MTTNAVPGTPAPDGAIEVTDWGEYEGTGGMQARLITWAVYDGGNVAVDGRQWPDGDFDAAVSAWVGDGAELDAAQARRLAAALLDAADKLDGIVST